MRTDEEHARMRARQLSAESVAAGDASGWFEKLYEEAEAGISAVPWADGVPNPHLVEWADGAAGMPDGSGRQALVVGCGLGYDAEFLAGRGFEVTAFDEEDPRRDPAMMPWPLTRSELDIAGGPLRAHRIEQFSDNEAPPKLRWRAEFRRDES